MHCATVLLQNRQGRSSTVDVTNDTENMPDESTTKGYKFNCLFRNFILFHSSLNIIKQKLN